MCKGCDIRVAKIINVCYKGLQVLLNQVRGPTAKIKKAAVCEYIKTIYGVPKVIQSLIFCHAPCVQYPICCPRSASTIWSAVHALYVHDLVCCRRPRWRWPWLYRNGTRQSLHSSKMVTNTYSHTGPLLTQGGRESLCPLFHVAFKISDPNSFRRVAWRGPPGVAFCSFLSSPLRSAPS